MIEPIAWTFSPDWSSPVLERLEWLTDVLDAENGTEQRISPRIVPRRSVEADFMLTEGERAWLSLLLQREGTAEFLVPLWFDRATLTAAASIGATSLSFDTTDREFRDGDSVLLVGPTAFECEVVTLGTVSSGGATLTGALAGNWRAGTALHPMRRGWVETRAVIQFTTRVGRSSLRFNIDDDAVLDGGSETFTSYLGYPLLSHKPNWRQEIEWSPEWRVEEFDGKTGPRLRTPTADRAFATVRYLMSLIGRSEIAAYRKLLYRISGRRVPFWVPTHAEDARVAVAASTSATALDINIAGYSLLDALTDDVAHLFVGGDLPVTATSVTDAGDPSRERLQLAAPLTRDVAAGEWASRMQVSRLEQDSITIRHLTDAVAESTLAWTAIDDSRDGSAPGDYPIPTATMSSTECGVEGDMCIILDFRNDTYSIHGVPKTLSEIANGGTFGTFDPANLVPGVGWVATATSADPYPTAHGGGLSDEAMAALGFDGYLAVMDFTLSGDTDGTRVTNGYFDGTWPQETRHFFGELTGGGGSRGHLLRASGTVSLVDVVNPLGPGEHRFAGTFTNVRSAGSVDGGPVASASLVDKPLTRPIFGVRAVNPASGTETATIHYLRFCPAVADELLPARSTP